MGKYLGSSCRLCRREGEKLFLKGTRCYTHRCAIDRRTYAPGEHGSGRRMKLSNYGLQLREKQKVKRIYGLYEKQFRNYFYKAARKKGVTGAILLQFLERRLDNVIYQLGFATSRKQARQIVSHQFILLGFFDPRPWIFCLFAFAHLFSFFGPEPAVPYGVYTHGMPQYP